jgi:hypothetical protein
VAVQPVSLLRGVVQDDMKGCGVACVATVTGKTYAQVRKRAEQAGDWRESYGMNGAMLRRMLRRYRRPVKAVTLKSQVNHQKFVPGGTAIVKVTGLVPCEVWRKGKRERRVRQWSHWVVWHDGSVWDPGHGQLWTGRTWTAGMAKYLESVRGATNVKTGRWHWL